MPNGYYGPGPFAYLYLCLTCCLLSEATRPKRVVYLQTDATIVGSNGFDEYGMSDSASRQDEERELPLIACAVIQRDKPEVENV